VVLFLFLTHLAIGIVFTLAVVDRGAGVRFFRFNAGMAAIMIAVAFAFRPEVGSTPMARAAFVALAVVETMTVLYWVTVGRTLASIRPAIVAAACVAGIAALVAQALDVSGGWPVPVQTLSVASFLTSAGLLGGACTAMVLGHWYLVIPSMQVEHLMAITKVHIASVVLRVVVSAAAVFFAIASWEPGAGPSFQRYIFSVAGIFFWQRVLFGLAGPAVLSYLTWETAKIRSTQSATGILYVDFFFVVVGEVLAKYLILATRVPV
jgi:protein NrfD